MECVLRCLSYFKSRYYSQHQGTWTYTEATSLWTAVVVENAATPEGSHGTVCVLITELISIIIALVCSSVVDKKYKYSWENYVVYKMIVSYGRQEDAAVHRGYARLWNDSKKMSWPKWCSSLRVQWEEHRFSFCHSYTWILGFLCSLC